MCGITGALSLIVPSVNINFTKPMVDKIAHRGPDDAGYLYLNTGTKQKKGETFYQNLTDDKFKNLSSSSSILDINSSKRELMSHEYDLFMGHRRLSILDVSYAGHQPMSDFSKNIWISYNGEIYNFKELRIELKKLGHNFKSNTDTEVIIYSYIQWGINCIKKFNGMFAFSLYDNKKKKFYLCRDRYGIKPIYYHFTKNRVLIYGSEIKSILEYKDYKGKIDEEALIEYFTFQNIFTNKTFHKEIEILESGHYFEIDLINKNYKKIQYWDFDYSKSEIIRDQREYIEEIKRLFSQAVTRQLISDVPIGSYLSGGIDSGSIASIASRSFQKSDQFLDTFTIGFDLSSANGLELSFDERSKSKFLSNYLNTKHHEMVLKSGDMVKCLPKFSYHLEEPRIGQSYPNYYAAKLASNSVKVVLSGVGGDELFGGYPWRYYNVTNNKNFDDYIDKYYKFWQRLIPNKAIINLFSPIHINQKKVWTRDIFKRVFKNSLSAKKPEDYINNSLYFEAKTFLHGLLVVEDKLSMAHSIETRVPFLDNDLVDFAQKIPVELKLKNLNKVIRMDENEISKIYKSNDGKMIFRKAMSDNLPSDFLTLDKQGFSSPDQSWFKGESINFVKKTIFNKSANIYRYMDQKTTQNLVEDHLNGKTNRRLFIWSLLNFEYFTRFYD